MVTVPRGRHDFWTQAGYHGGGMNKVAGTLEGAIDRARHVAAPINAARFAGLGTPCAKLGTCADCLSPDSICCQMVITRLSRVKGRIKVILVGENIGF